MDMDLWIEGHEKLDDVIDTFLKIKNDENSTPQDKAVAEGVSKVLATCKLSFSTVTPRQGENMKKIKPGNLKSLLAVKYFERIKNETGLKFDYTDASPDDRDIILEELMEMLQEYDQVETVEDMMTANIKELSQKVNLKEMDYIGATITSDGKGLTLHTDPKNEKNIVILSETKKPMDLFKEEYDFELTIPKDTILTIADAILAGAITKLKNME